VSSSLSDDWLAAWVGAGRKPGASGTVQVVVSGDAGGAGGVGPWAVRVDDGVVAEVASGPATEPDATLTIAYDDAIAIADGALDPAVAFMRGQLKTAGDPGLVLDVLAAAGSIGR